MQVAVNFENETIAQKVLWMLEHFKDDGVEVVRLDNTDDEIINNFKDGLKEKKVVCPYFFLTSYFFSNVLGLF